MWDKENGIISIESNTILTTSTVEEKRTCNDAIVYPVGLQATFIALMTKK